MYRYSIKHGMLAQKKEKIAFPDIKAYIFPKVVKKTELPSRENGVPASDFKEFSVVYVIDWSKLFPQIYLLEIITSRHLEAWGIDRTELCRTAMENLSKSRFHIRYVVKDRVTWDSVLMESIPDVTVYQLILDSAAAESYALDIILLSDQLSEIERIIERPFYLILCEPYPLIIPYVPFDQDLDFNKIYTAVSNSSYAPDTLFCHDVYLFEFGKLKKTGKKIL